MAYAIKLGEEEYSIAITHVNEEININLIHK